MKIGIGLPSTIPGAGPARILEWAKAAEEHRFSSLAVTDRLVYGNTEPLVTLGAAAAVTRRITLTTSILLAPLRINAALLAKQAATLNHLSGGRLLLGMAVGSYQDDYAASGVPFHQRGSCSTRCSTRWPRSGPASPGERREPSARNRAWTGRRSFSAAGASAPSRGWRPGARAGSAAAGESRRSRAGPRAYGVLGPSRAEPNDRGSWRCRTSLSGRGPKRTPRAFLMDHSAIEGAAAARVMSHARTDAASVRDAMTAYERAGCDELVMFPSHPDPEQVRLLADVVR